MKLFDLLKADSPIGNAIRCGYCFFGFIVSVWLALSYDKAYEDSGVHEWIWIVITAAFAVVHGFGFVAYLVITRELIRK